MDYLRRLRQALVALKTPADVETGRRDTIDAGRGFEPLAQSDELLMFRLLVGIYQDQSFRPPRGFTRDNRPIVTTSDRPAPNIGVYVAVCNNESKAKQNFRQFSILINVCLGLQLVVAAALTAIGAGGGGRAVVTVFGAINTIIAGFLTFLKGSGLPNRFKYYQNQWGKVREYIEQKERDLALGRVFVDIYAEVEIIRRMYEDVRADIEANTPERFMSSNIRAHTSITPPRPAYLPQQPDSDPSKPNSMEQRLMSMLSSLESKGRDWVHEKEKSVNTVGDGLRQSRHSLAEEVMGLKNKLESKMLDIQAIEKRLHDEKQARVQATTEEMRGMANATIREVSNLEQDIEARAAAAIQQRRDQAHEATRSYLDEKLGSSHNGEGDSKPKGPS